MSLQDIYNDLNNALHDGVITLSWSTVPNLGLTLEAIGIKENETLTLTGATLTLGPRSVVLIGNAAYRDFSWITTLTGEPVSTGNRFTLALQGQDAQTAWTFGTSFPDLPQSRTISDHNTVPLGDSVLAPLVVEQPVLSVTTEPPKPKGGFKPSFQGSLVLTDSSLEQYIVYFMSAKLRLTGTIDFLDPAKPVLVLYAAAPFADIGIPVISISEVGIKLRSDADDIFSLQEDEVNSVAEVYANISFGKAKPITAEVTTPLLQGNFVWPLTAVFSEPITAVTGFALILDFFGQPPGNLYLFPFPLVDNLLRNFGVKAVGVGIQPPLDGQELELKYAQIALTSVETWRPALAFVTVRELGTAWTFHWSGANNWVTGNVWGKLTFFDDPTLLAEPLSANCSSNKIELALEATIPDWNITARNESDICVPLAAVLKKYLGGSGGIPDDLRITNLFLQAIPPQQTYQASLMVEGLWATQINLVKFSLDKVIGEIYVTQSKVFGSITAMVGLAIIDGGVETTKATFNISAEYKEDGIWRFEGGLADGVLSLFDFAWGLLGFKPAFELPQVLLTELWITYENSTQATSNPYSARGSLEIRWQPQVLGLTLSAIASAYVERREKETAKDSLILLNSPQRGDANNAQMIYVGELSGTFIINRLSVRLAVQFSDKEEVFIFEVTFGKITVRAATEWVQNVTAKPPGGKHQILVITLRGLTLGEIVTYLVKLANPNINYQLEAPWTFLNSIDLSRFEVRIDPTENKIALTYRVDLNLPFLKVDSVGLMYDKSSGEGKVRFIITGDLLGKKYDMAKPLTWDAANDPPPQVPGAGKQLIDLRYLGAGQHVTLTGLTQFNSITEVLKKLREEMQPINDPKKNPLEQSSLRFDPASQWMFGIDITVMDTVSVGIVLHDPDLYGLVLSLKGSDAGALAGLSFELLYKKVTDDIGVFRVRLQIPDAFRQINLGYVSITLGVITVDIFTNGNFMIDLGFPHNRDFTNSFGLEAGIFIGRGGLYFGVLNGATSTRVPKITNGNFSPVIELGIGLSLGVGRTFEKGPLKAGMYLQALAIFEGVLAWFHPTDQSQPNKMYFSAQGMIGLIGKLYGSVDFKVIAISLSVEIWAIVTFKFASYRASLIGLDIGIKVNASIKIIFITISFSFQLNLKASFTIGSDSPTPWILAADQSGRSPLRLAGNAAIPRRRHSLDVSAWTREVHLRQRFGKEGARLRLSAGDATYDLNWPTDINVFPNGQVHPVAIKMLPAYLIDQVVVQWPNQQPQSNNNPAYRINFMLMTDSGVPPAARTIKEASRLTTDHLASADTVADIAFNVLIEAMFRWSVSALGLDPVTGVVSLGQLEELARQLDLPETEASLDMTTLSQFFTLNLEMRLSGMPSVESQNTKPSDSSGTVFPIPPPLGWDSSTPEDERRFETYQPIDSTYEKEVRHFFAQLDPQPAATQLADAHQVNEGDPTESMATFFFRDYFLLIAKASVQAALNVMSAFPYTVTGASSESLSSIAGLFPTVSLPYVKREGDTVDQVADAFGMSTSEILWLNPNLEAELRAAVPGQTIEVVIGTTPESIASGNPSWPLQANLPIHLGDVLHQVLDGETLESIATKFGANIDTWLQDPALLVQLNLLLPGAEFVVPQSSFVNQRSLSLALVAAFFYVRDEGTDHLGLIENGEVPLVEWYVQTIGTLNAIDFAGPLPESVLVPKAFDDLSDPITWFTQPGDTVWTIAGMFAVWENQAGNTEFATWMDAMIAANPGSNPGSVLARVMIPQMNTHVFPGEELGSIATRFPIELPSTPGQWLDRAASFRLIVKNATILAPLTPVTVPQCNVTTTTDQTLSAFADFYALSLEEIGTRLAGVGGLLATWDDHTLTVPHPASAPIGSGTPTASDLMPVILHDHGASIAGQTSRFLVAGLRIPAPVKGADDKYHATGPMTGLYELTGQQLPGPLPLESCDPPPPPTERLRITVKNYDPNAKWLTLYNSATLTGEELLTATHHTLNPGLARKNKRLLRGLVALSAPIEELVYSITDVDLCENYPAPVLDQVFITPPAPRPLFRDVPVRNTLQHQITWQTTETIVIPNPRNVTVPSTGMPTLWPFSDELMRAEILYPNKAFDLRNVDPQLGPSAEPEELTLYAWATMIDIRIRTIPGLTNTYEVFGADTAGRQLLLEVWQYLNRLTDTATVSILYQQSVSAGLPSGLTSVPVTEDQTYIIKTNLTTETQSGAALTAFDGPPPFGDYYARLADSLRFLTLMWECSVVGGGGYWLQYTSASGAGLPQSIFSSDGTATLSLLVLLASQMNTNTPDRKLHSFNTTALVGNSIDASSSNVFAQVADGSEQEREATVDPGNVAFFTSLENPPPNTDPIDKQIAVRQLYGMLAYQLLPATAFAGSTPSMPVGPQVPESSDEETWDLFQVIPIWRYALAHPLPHVDGLPSPDLDPYAGITGASNGGTWTMANTSVSLSFRDVYGNNSQLSGDASTGGPDLIPLNVGYTDPVIGVGAWPATTANYTVLPAPNGATLLANFSLQASTHLPAGMQRTSDSAATAANQLRDFSKVYYQLSQSDVSYSLSTTLETIDGNPQPLATTGSLLEFAAGACAWLNSARELANFYVDTALAPDLAAASETYGVGYEGLGMANGHVPLSRIFTPPSLSPAPGVDFMIPVYAVFPDGGTIASITPLGRDPVAVLEDDENTSLLLHAGAELAIPSKNYLVPTDPPDPGLPLSLTQIAEANNITIASLVTANQLTPSLLRVGFVFTCEGVEVFITPEHPDVTLDDVARTFQDKGINYDAVMVAGANPLLPGMFRAGALLVIDHYIIKPDETLSSNGTGATVTQLAQRNTTTVDLFFSGTAVYVNAIAAGGAFNETINEASTMYGLSPDQLLRFNRNVALAAVPSAPSDPLYLAIPGHAALPSPPSSLRIPYRIPANATLDGIAALFVDMTALSLAQANEELPGVLAGGKNITVAGQTVTTTDGESFSELLGSFNPAVTLDQVVAVIAATPGYLKSGSLLLTTPAKLASSAQTPLQVAERYSIAVNDFAVANSGLANIVVAGVELELPIEDDLKARIITGASDTFVSFVWRFAQQGVQTTVADVLKANSDRAFIAGAATILLPPAPAHLSASIGVNGWKFPSAIFDVQTFVEIKRQSELVDPAFHGTSAARNVVSVPAVSRNTGAGADAYLALQQFARDIKAAIPVLRIATGKVLADDREQTTTDVWGIAFGGNYIESVTIKPGVTVGSEKIPQYFALRPLDNALVARNGVKIKPLLDDGTLGIPELTDFQGVDMETWAQRFLADVDLFISAPYAAAAYQTPKRQTLESVLESKQLLAEGIASGLDYILDLGQPDPSLQNPPPPDWSSAVESLRQRLLVSLSAGYNVDAVIQYVATVSSPWTNLYANLSGPGKLADDPALNQMRTTLTSAKTSLTTTPPNEPSNVNFLLSIAEEGRGRSANLQIHYPINEVEFNIKEIVDGYDASDWVTLVLTDDLPSSVSIDLGKPDVPLPVRSYPPLPTLLDQTAAATHPTPASYAEAMLWDYSFAYQHQSMAVDQMRLEVEFNQTPLLVAAKALDDVDLLAALAQYDTVAPQLWDLLKQLPDYAKAADKTRIDNAMETFASLVTTVATAWSRYWSSDIFMARRMASALGPQPERYTFLQTLDATFDEVLKKWFYTKLFLKREVTEGPLGWPVMAVYVGDRFVTMGSGVDTPEGRQYDFPEGVEAFNLLALEMRFAGLEIASYQNASSQVQVVRNANLSNLAPTRPAFVYQTQWFAFPNLVSPLLSWRDPFPIGAWTTDPATNPLTPVFNQLFGAATDNRTISCGVRYGYELATSPDGDRIVPYLPVKFRPKFTYVPSPATGTVQQIITAVDTWFSQVQPVTNGGEWLIGLNLYSSVDGQMDRPLLELPVFSTL